MRGRHLNVIAILTVAAIAACGGDGAADGELDDTPPAGMADTATGAAQDTPDAQPPGDLPEGVTPEQVAQGQQIFTGQGGCVACHGPDATGTQLAPDLTDSEWINVSGPDMDEITELIRTGVPQPVEHPAPMPPMGGANLTDEQVQALASYVIALAG